MKGVKLSTAGLSGAAAGGAFWPAGAECCVAS